MTLYAVYIKEDDVNDITRAYGIYMTESDAIKEVEKIKGRGDTAVCVPIEWDEPLKFRVFVDVVGRRNFRGYNNLSYNKAIKIFDENINCRLQLPQNQFGNGKYAVDVLTKYEDDFFERERLYWESEEEKERGRYYSPSCPWNAPGMKMSDFI